MQLLGHQAGKPNQVPGLCSLAPNFGGLALLLDHEDGESL